MSPEANYSVFLCLIFFKKNTVHQISVPGEDSKYFYPLHLIIGIVKEKTMQSSTKWNNTLLT